MVKFCPKWNFNKESGYNGIAKFVECKGVPFWSNFFMGSSELLVPDIGTSGPQENNAELQSSCIRAVSSAHKKGSPLVRPEFA